MTDVVVVGAGAIGLSSALHLAQQGHDVLVLEKEQGPGRHQSGRNSGVIHAGYNLKPGSLKARYCAQGNSRLHAFAKDHDVPVGPHGILVVAQDEAEVSTLHELARRAHANGVDHRILDEAGMHAIEPHVQGIAALHAPGASSIDPEAYVRALHACAQEAGVRFGFATAVRWWQERSDCVRIHAGRDTVQARVLLNAAGLHADRVARHLAQDLRIVPFRGYYARVAEGHRDLVRSHIYAPPDLDFPFLGVHLSRRTDGTVTVGPGAMLALGREAYHLLGMRPRDLVSLAAWPGTWRLLSDGRIRALVGGELAKTLSLARLAKEARALVPSLPADALVRGVPAGNRAQLVDRQGRLVDDVVVRETARTVHVLNAVSPGLTCSLPFGEELARRAASKV